MSEDNHSKYIRSEDPKDAVKYYLDLLAEKDFFYHWSEIKNSKKKNFKCGWIKKEE